MASLSAEMEPDIRPDRRIYVHAASVDRLRFVIA